MPKWLTPTLMWGGLALAVIFAIGLLVVDTATTTAPVTLYWVVLVVGVVAAIVGFVLSKRQPKGGAES